MSPEERGIVFGIFDLWTKKFVNEGNGEPEFDTLEEAKAYQLMMENPRRYKALRFPDDY